MILAQEMHKVANYEVNIESTQSSAAESDILFIHGSPSSIHDLSKDSFKRLADQARLISYDRPGHLQSPLSEEPLSLTDQAEIVTEVARMKCRAKPILMAHSIGAAIALKALQQAPSNFAGVILISPYVFRRNGDGKPSTAMTSLMRLYAAGRVLRTILAKTLGGAAIEKNIKESSKPRGISNQELENIAFRHTLPQSILAMMEEKNAFLNEIDQLSSTYKNIKTPMAIISGRSDAVIPFVQSESLLAKIPEAILIEEENAGHSLSHISSENFDRALNWILGEGESNASVQGL